MSSRIYVAYGSPRRTDTAPAGAFIFWPSINDVAISLGDGRYVTTMGKEGSYTPNAIRRVGEAPYGAPTGWAMP